jgi:hypothetical protein
LYARLPKLPALLKDFFRIGVCYLFSPLCFLKFLADRKLVSFQGFYVNVAKRKTMVQALLVKPDLHSTKI